MSNSTFKVFVDKMGGENPDTFIGQQGELFYDPTGSTLKISDGVTAGGVSISPSENAIVNITEAAPGAASGTVTYNGTNGTRYHVHTAVPTGNWTANFSNLSLATNEATHVVVIVPGAAADYTMTASQIDGTASGVTNLTQSLKASKTKTNIFDLDVVKTGASTYSIYGYVTSY